MESGSELRAVEFGTAESSLGPVILQLWGGRKVAAFAAAYIPLLLVLQISY
jgi:hypothetical protein